MELKSNLVPKVKPMESMQPTSKLPAIDVARLSCPAHAPGYGESRPEVAAVRGSDVEQGQQPEAYQADRAFHALLSRLTGGISAVALSLAFIDWASHLMAAPQRQVEISQEAWRNAMLFFV